MLGLECDNNNDFDIASVKALDNKLCSEVCLPGEWHLPDVNLVRVAPLLSRRGAHLLPSGSCGSLG